MNDYDRCSLENQIFSWEDCEGMEPEVYDFIGVVLKVDIGPDHFKNPMYKGRRFAHAVFNPIHSYVIFYDTNDDETGHKYALNVSVGAKLE